MARTFSGRKLQAARKAAGVPLARVALDTGRSPEAVRAYEAGKIDPPASIVARLADAVGVDPGELFADDREKAA